MREDKYIKRGRALEQDGSILKRKLDKPKNYEEKLFGKLFSAGRNYELGQDIYHAKALYNEAKRYVDYVGKNSKEALLKGIKGLERQRENIQGVLRGNAPLFQKQFKRSFVFPILSIAFLLSALLFTSISLTGYSVFELNQNNSLFIGTGLFIFGLVFAFVYFRRRKNNG
jgi:hypothetical protein